MVGGVGHRRRFSVESAAIEQENVRPAVAVIVENGNAAACRFDDVLFGSCISIHVLHGQPGFWRDIYEPGRSRVTVIREIRVNRRLRELASLRLSDAHCYWNRQKSAQHCHPCEMTCDPDSGLAWEAHQALIISDLAVCYKFHAYRIAFCLIAPRGFLNQRPILFPTR